jgi:hypothetical protein
MAFVGAGTASADELCTTAANAENMCPAGSKITEIHATLTKGKSGILHNTAGETIVTCTAGTVKGKITTGNETKKTGMSGPVEALTWGETGTACSLPTKTTVLGTIDASSGGSGATTVKATETQVTINTVFFGSCVYGAGAGLTLGTIPAGGNTLNINTVVNKISGGGLCPETSKWTAEFTVTNHNKVFYVVN